MEGFYLGLDTSNYTTSAALYDGEKQVWQKKKLLAVKDGTLGLRQSDAVFSHVRQLGEITEALFSAFPERPRLLGVGVSVRPRDVEGSYMPCFLAGEMAARVLCSADRLPLARVSHQAGHIAAALYSAGRMELLDKPFAAFHLSGGTTECVLVRPDGGGGLSVSLFSRSLDLKAGQAVDRVGALLGLPFPAGPQLERLALDADKPYRIKPVMKGRDCSLSGIENQCRGMKDRGEPDRQIARFCLDSITAAVDGMTAALRAEQGEELPILYAGGVMSNGIIREKITNKYGGSFADPAFSSDNAAGVAILACRKLARKGGCECLGQLLP